MEAGTTQSKSSASEAETQLAAAESKLQSTTKELSAAQLNVEQLTSQLKELQQKQAQAALHVQALTAEIKDLKALNDSMKQASKQATASGSVALTEAQAALADAKRRCTTIEGELQLTRDSLTAKLNELEAKRTAESKSLNEQLSQTNKLLVRLCASVCRVDVVWGLMFCLFVCLFACADLYAVWW